MPRSVPSPDAPTVSHRRRPPLAAPYALGLTVAGLLLVFGLGAAVLPDSVAGRGVPAQAAAADVIRPLADGSADGSADGTTGAPGSTAAAQPAAPSATPPSAAAGRPAVPAKPKPKPKPSHKPKPAPKPAPVGSDFLSQENEVVRLVNVQRGKAGCGALRLDTRLRTAMRLHVQELAKHGNLYISHVSDDGRTFVDRIKAQGYKSPGGENVARGQSDAADVMNSWMNSPGHRANILNCSFKAIGVGVARGVDHTLVWGQDFGYA